MVSFIKESIMRYLTHMGSENLLSYHQRRFINRRSAAKQLLPYFDKHIKTIISGGVNDAFYFDFANAFVNVPHQRLFSRLISHKVIVKILS